MLIICRLEVQNPHWDLLITQILILCMMELWNLLINQMLLFMLELWSHSLLQWTRHQLLNNQMTQLLKSSDCIGVHSDFEGKNVYWIELRLSKVVIQSGSCSGGPLPPRHPSRRRRGGRTTKSTRGCV